MSVPAVLFHSKFQRQAATTGPQFQDFISRVFYNIVNALELSHNDCYSSTAVPVPSKLVPSHAVCYQRFYIQRLKQSSYIYI